MSGEQKTAADEAYYRELLQRVDTTIAQTHKVTASNAYAGLAKEPLWVRLLKEHSIIGIYYHRDVENEFTRTLKLFFFTVSVLWCILLSLKIRLATEFADWLVVTVLLHAIHWGQRALFHKFQTWLLLWPATAAVEFIALLIADLVLLGKGGSWAWRRLFSLGFSSYIIGFLCGEAFTLWYRARRREKQQQASALDGPEQQQLEDSLTADSTEEYSTL